MPTFALHPIDCFALHFVLSFVFWTFFATMEFTGCGLFFATQVNYFFFIHLIIAFAIFCTARGHVFLFMDYCIPPSLEVD